MLEALPEELAFPMTAVPLAVGSRSIVAYVDTARIGAPIVAHQ